MMKFKKIFITLIIVITLLTTQPVFTTVFASDNFDDLEYKLTSILFVDSQLTREEIIDTITYYAEMNNISFEESITIFYQQAEIQKNNINNFVSRSNNAGSGAPTAPREARNKGDLMYSAASTFGINHGHSAIYYTTTTVVHAIGPGVLSRSESAYNNIGRKGSIELQSVSTTVANRNKAANHAYNHLRNKPYDNVFAANKITTSKLNCSSLVWRAYMHVNIDLDSNGGPGVYPADIRNSRFTSTYARR